MTKKRRDEKNQQKLIQELRGHLSNLRNASVKAHYNDLLAESKRKKGKLHQ